MAKRHFFFKIFVFWIGQIAWYGDEHTYTRHRGGHELLNSTLPTHNIGLWLEPYKSARALAEKRVRKMLHVECATYN